jgi:hypothetical protein
MAEKKNVPAVKADLGFAIPSIRESGFVNDATAKLMVDMLDEFDDEVEITSEYLVPEQDVPYRAFFLGLKSVKNPEGNEVQSARFLMEDGTFKTCASTMLVNNVSGLDEKTPIMFVKTGTGTNSKKQEYDQFSIKLLGKKD